MFRECFGISITNELLLAGKKMTAQEAHHHRFVSKVLPTTDLLIEEGLAIARQMIAFPLAEKTLPLFKTMVKYPSRMSEMQSVHEMELGYLGTRMRNGESATGVLEFFQKKDQEKAQKSKL